VDHKKKRKLKDMKNENLFEYFNDYLKEIITEDLKRIHGRKPRILDHEEPWVFQLGQQ